MAKRDLKAKNFLDNIGVRTATGAAIGGTIGKACGDKVEKGLNAVGVPFAAQKAAKLSTTAIGTIIGAVIGATAGTAETIIDAPKKEE